jgi:hypothetical protein
MHAMRDKCDANYSSSCGEFNSFAAKLFAGTDSRKQILVF